MGAAGSRGYGLDLTKDERDRIKRRMKTHTGKSDRISLADFEDISDFSTNAFISCIFKYADSNKDGYISTNDFIDAVESLGRMGSEEERLRLAFEFYDMDRDGYVSADDLAGVLQTTTKGLQSALKVQMAAASLIREYDYDHDGRLSFDEFRQLASVESEVERPF